MLTGGSYYIYRSFYPFTTSDLGAGASISAATFSLYHNNGSPRNDDSASIGVVRSTQASATDLVVEDFDQLGTTLGADYLSLSSITGNAYNDFALNATALTWIDPVGSSMFGLRISLDISNTAPTGNNDLNSNGFSFSEVAGTDNDPKLVITYTAGGGGGSGISGYKSLLGVGQA